jgi:flagellar biosynthetic protein FliR
MIGEFLAQFLTFVFVLTRVGALFASLPVFGSQNIPLQFRALAALTIALMITPSFWGVTPPEPGNLLGLGVMLARELVLGLALGLSVNILFSGMQLAGQLIAQVSGLSLADVYNPSLDTNVPVFAQLLDATTLAVFVILGGHRQVLDALLDSFHDLPPGRAEFAPTIIEGLTAVLSSSFLTGLRAAAPVMVALLLAVLIVALISRTLPQLNSINLGFSLNTLVLLGTLAFSIGSAVWIFQDETDHAIETIRDALQPPVVEPGAASVNASQATRRNAADRRFAIRNLQFAICNLQSKTCSASPCLRLGANRACLTFAFCLLT